MLSQGTEAPSFRLSGLGTETDDGSREFREYTLGELLGELPVILAFYPGDFSPVCTDELCSLRDISLSALDRSMPVVGISRDTPFTHEAFAYEHDIDFPLLSDIDGSVCRAYEAIHADAVDSRGVETGMPKRTVYFVDEDGVIVHAWQTDDPYTAPDVESMVDRALSGWL